MVAQMRPALPMKAMGDPRGGVFEELPSQLTRIFRLGLTAAKQSDHHADHQGSEHDGQRILLGAFASGSHGLVNPLPGETGNAIGGRAGKIFR